MLSTFNSLLGQVVVNGGGGSWGLVSLAIVFFIIALIAYILGARGVAGMSAGIGKLLLFVFLVLAVIALIIGLVNNA